jgi:hypothetical protein
MAHLPGLPLSGPFDDRQINSQTTFNMFKPEIKDEIVLPAKKVTIGDVPDPNERLIVSGAGRGFLGPTAGVALVRDLSNRLAANHCLTVPVLTLPQRLR